MNTYCSIFTNSNQNGQKFYYAMITLCISTKNTKFLQYVNTNNGVMPIDFFFQITDLHMLPSPTNCKSSSVIFFLNHHRQPNGFVSLIVVYLIILFHIYTAIGFCRSRVSNNSTHTHTLNSYDTNKRICAKST